MKYVLFLLISVFYTFGVVCQDHFLKLVNETLDDYENTIEKQERKISDLKSEIDVLILSKNENDKELKDALQKLHFSNLKLSEKENELNKVKKSLASSTQENIDLKKNVKTLTENIDRLRNISEREKEYSNNLLEELGTQGKEKLYLKAKQNAEKDFNAGRNSTASRLFKYGEPQLYFHTGYKFIQGLELQLIYGYSINRDGNIFLGLGLGYNEYNKHGGFAIIPIYLSNRIALGQQFTTFNTESFENEISENVAYSIIDFGYSALLTSGNQEIVSGGLLTNFGLGVMGSLAKNLSISTELSWRRQRVKIDKSSGVTEGAFINTVDLKLGFSIYLGR